MDLSEALRKERLASYIRLRGGYPVPLAGAAYWVFLGILGYYLAPYEWSLAAFIATGSIFPLALLFAKIFNNNFMKDKTAVTSVLLPAFASMLLFWPLAVAALWTEVQMVPLILAIALSSHWPVIGWSYGRTFLFTAHSVIRALVVFGIWYFLPDDRFTILPLAVAVVYLATVIAIFIDSDRQAKKLVAANMATSN